MSEERNSGSSSSKNTGTSRNRDKRFFATIQSALGGGGDSSHGGANRLNKCQTMNNDEEVTLSNALQRISINNNDNTTSLDDVSECFQVFNEYTGIWNNFGLFRFYGMGFLM
jgi:hypothetical protein